PGWAHLSGDEAAAHRDGRLIGGAWSWRGRVALTAVALGFAVYPLTEPGHDVINSDWPAFATGAKLALTDPSHIYDLAVQQRVQLEVTGGAQLVVPIGVALLAQRSWRVLAGWAAAGVVLWASFAVLNPRWVLEWLAPLGTPVQSFSREVDLPHFGTALPTSYQLMGVVLLTLI